jgi:hypothetical protein
MFKMDMSKLKHVKSDAKSTTLRHPDGHEIMLQHATLPKEAQAQLSALSKLATAEQTQDQASEAHDQKMARGGEVPRKMYADPQEPVAENDSAPAAIPAPADPASQYREADPGILEQQRAAAPPAPTPAPKDFVNDYTTALHGATTGMHVVDPDTEEFKDGQPPSMPNHEAMQYAQARQDARDAAAKSALASQASQTDVLNADRARLGQAPLPNMAKDKLAGMQPPDQGPANDQAPQQANGPTNYMDPAQSGMGAAFDLAEKGINEDAAVKGAQGVLDQNALQNNIEAQRAAQASFQDASNDVNGELDGVIKDLQANHIDPNKYWTGDAQGNGSHSKIAAGLGMILAGFNPTNRPNAAIEMLQHQMDRNLQGQVADMDRKKTLVGAYMQKYHNKRDAIDMARITQNAIMEHSLQQNAASLAGPQAKANADKALSVLQQQRAQWQMQLGLRQSLMNLAGANGGPVNDAAIQHSLAYADMMHDPQAKEMRQRYFPGLGIAQTIPSEQQRADVLNHKNVLDLISKAQALANKRGTATSWDEIQGGKTLINELQSAIRTGEHQGTYKEGDAGFLNDTIGSNPAGFSAALTSSPKLKQLMSIYSNSYQNNLKSLGLRPPGAQQQAPRTFSSFKPSR